MVYRTYIIILILLLFISCAKSTDNEVEYIFYKNSFFSKQNLEQWNRSTIKTIDSLTVKLKRNDKLQYIRSALLNTEESEFPNYTLLNRDSFFEWMNNVNLLEEKIKYENIFIVERHMAGEVYTRDKILVIQKADTSIFLTVRHTRKGWTVIERGIITDLDIEPIYNGSSLTSELYWGDKMEEFLIISKFQGSKIKVKIFTSLSKVEYERFDDILVNLY